MSDVQDADLVKFVFDFLANYNETYSEFDGAVDAPNDQQEEGSTPGLSFSMSNEDTDTSGAATPNVSTVPLPAAAELSEGRHKRKRDSVEEDEEVAAVPPPAEVAGGSQLDGPLPCQWPGCEFEAHPHSLWVHIYTQHLPLRQRHMVVPNEGRNVDCEWGDCKVQVPVSEMLAHWKNAHRKEAVEEANEDANGQFLCRRGPCQKKTRRGIVGTRLHVSSFPKHLATIHHKSTSRMVKCEICGSEARRDRGRNNRHFRDCLVGLMNKPSFKNGESDHREADPSRPIKRQRET